MNASTRVPHAITAVTIAVMVAAACGMPRSSAQAADPAAAPGRAEDEAAIRAATARYLEALGRGDGPALAAMWTPDGDIIDDEGRLMNGREAVGRITPVAEGGRPHDVSIRQTRLRFLTADVALEDGVVAVAAGNAARPLEGWFSATWLKQGAAWRLTGLRESRISPPQDATSLEDLAWMVGEWTVAEDRPASDAAAAPRLQEPRIDLVVRWNPTRTFLIRDLTITPASGPTGEQGEAVIPTQITQRIGWDPLSRQIVSWVFGSDGSHGEATWSREDGTWVARTRSVLPDGTQTASLNIYAYDGNGRCTWRSIPTHVGGEHAPHISMTMVRKRPLEPQGSGVDR